MGASKVADRKKKEEEEDAEVGTVEKEKNWSSVNLCYKDSKLTFRGSLNPIAFTNWLRWRCIRPKLEETKAKLQEVDLEEMKDYGIEDLEEIFGEFAPAMKK